MNANIETLIESLNQPLRFLVLFGISVVVGVFFRYLLLKSLKLYSQKEDAVLVRSVIKHLSNVLNFLLPALILLIAINFTEILNENFKKDLTTAFTIITIITFSLLFIKLAYVLEDVILAQYDLTKEDNLRERKLVTQIKYIKKIILVVVSVIGLSTIFISIEGLRSIGAGLLSSAGVAGIIIGFAAQKTIANLLAGFQIAFTQPIKIDDAVVVENEWGWIEEINLTYVVIRIWDWRRLVLPITYFIEKPFQNWTRTSGDLLGSVFVYTDFRLPVEDLRKEFHRILDNEPLWDKNASVLQVTDADENRMEIRMLMSSNNSPNAFNLRCAVREKIIAYIQKKYPEYLPITRVRLHDDKFSSTENKE